MIEFVKPQSRPYLLSGIRRKELRKNGSHPQQLNAKTNYNRRKRLLIDYYCFGECATFAQAMKFMTGWPVFAVGDSEDWSHVGVVNDGLVWDAAGPRLPKTFEKDYDRYSKWQPARGRELRQLFTNINLRSKHIESIKDAIFLFGEQLYPHIKRIPRELVE